MDKKQQPLQRKIFEQAFRAALDAPYPHDRSPAFALQAAYEHTKHPIEDDLDWLRRFVTMDGREYEEVLGWDIGDGRWSDTPDMIIAGKTILNDCVRWFENGWDLSRHPRDRFEYREDDQINEIDSGAVARIHHYLQPIPGEVMRYRWTRRDGGKSVLCTFDIWHGPSRDFRWCFTAYEDAPVVVLGPPMAFWMIAGFIAPSVVPPGAECVPFIPNEMEEEVE